MSRTRSRTNRVYFKLMWRSLAPDKKMQWADVLWPAALFAAILLIWEGAVRILAIPDIILPANGRRGCGKPGPRRLGERLGRGRLEGARARRGPLWGIGPLDA